MGTEVDLQDLSVVDFKLQRMRMYRVEEISGCEEQGEEVEGNEIRREGQSAVQRGAVLSTQRSGVHRIKSFKTRAVSK